MTASLIGRVLNPLFATARERKGRELESKQSLNGATAASMGPFGRYLVRGAGLAILLLVGLVFLPHDRYIRFQDFRIEAYARLGWIYERIHFDPTPIDVAFVGTSRTMNGVDAAAVAALMSERSGPGTRPLHAANFGIPGYGRNLHWLIARELLENRKVGVLVLEIFENETRKPHPLFVYPADVSDVLGAPALINLSYVHDIMRLPFRQLSLFVKSLWPEGFGLKRRFDPARYDGETVDNTRFVHVNGRALTPLRDGRIDPAVLDAIASSRNKEKNVHMMGRLLDDLEYHFPRYYVRQILDLADRNRVPVKFLYLTSYGRPNMPYDSNLYEGRGEIITVNDILAKKENWGDIDHLNLYGAAELSARLATMLAQDHGESHVRLGNTHSK